MTLEEIRTGKKVNICHLHIFGYKAQTPKYTESSMPRIPLQLQKHKMLNLQTLKASENLLEDGEMKARKTQQKC
jgi:hypothetical protein